MKVGTLTYPGSPSHGASLQMYALYTVLNEMGADASVINYIPDGVIHKKRAKSICLSSKIKNHISALFLKSSKAAFKKFESQITMHPKKPISTTDELVKQTASYDRIIVGSDQVWNPVVTDNDMNFYLEFCSDKAKKASYAPSFGVDNVASDDREKIASLLSDITYLSAREKRGQEIISELTGRSVPLVLDPTFLLDASAWRKIKKTSGAKGKYVFVFTIKPSPILKSTAQRFADMHGCKLVYISGGLRGVKEKFTPRKYPVFGIGPAEFVDLIDNAEYVFTNSFHGTVFSIILGKKFFVEFSSDTNSRLENVISEFRLEQCVIDCYNFSADSIDIDYDLVYRILSEKRSESISYLESIIE